ncbi:TPA: site-specific integrase [Corynebacterium striatum]|uniref:site-specific integrase n=1 Tax=Corynebacterium striatum TaxID=43770 RepID=UPI00141A0A0D|nr:site-specific integrase [Corynebacterium striatum]NHX53011.1 site-specific integrase [Corynebacterium striatum]NHY37623.1 site-specific integrase [Corynebacterium striatum]HAT1133969.1 site-specific integrase [Corynebacterium striatum]HAT1156543.1 site-specific integrase [Corynebacterium striatum]HAT1159806.1 site-specific integrase [Corynebacterium striatum]
MPKVRSIGNLNRDTKTGLYYRILDLGHRPNGNRWRVRVTAKNKQRLNVKVKAKVEELENDTYSPGDMPTLNVWWEYWCDHIAFHRVKPNVLRNYRGYGRNHIRHIGKNKLDQLTPDHVRYLHKKMHNEGLSDRMVQAVHNTLSKCLKDAVVEGKIPTNPCDRMDRPKANSKERESFTRDEVKAIITTAQGDGHMLYARWLMALLLGARQSECLGLEWERVDLDAGLLDLSWQVQRIPWMHGENCGCPPQVKGARCPIKRPAAPSGYEHRPCYMGKWFVRPKTKSSQRLLPIPAPLLAELMVLHERSMGEGLVFHDDRFRPVDNSDDDLAWANLCERAGVRPLVLHSARHTMVSLLLDAGVDAETIRQIAGHSTVLSTRGYMHVSTDAARAALDRLGE